MASTEGLVPITRTFLASYYDKYIFPPLSDSVSHLSDELHSLSQLLQDHTPLSQGEISLLHEAESQPPHKIDENMWKNREHMEEILFLLEKSHWPNEIQQQSTSEDAELPCVLGKLKDKIENTLKILESFQTKNSESIFNTVMTYMPQDFRGTLISQQKERSERNKQAAFDALVQSGASIHERYALLWNQQMERRKQLAQLGGATGVYRTLVKYLVGVPQVLLDFIKQLNDDHGPMEEQRERYGPPLYSLTKMVLFIRLFLSLSWRRYEALKLERNQISILEEAVGIYTSELERFLEFIGVVFMNSPFFITAEEAGAIEAGKIDYKEIIIPSGKTYEVLLDVESVNSYIAWDFSIVQGKMNMDIGFSLEHTNSSGDKTLMFPYRRYECDQGNFSTCLVGTYKLVWDNSYSTFFKKVLRYKVDCIPPVVEPLTSVTEEEQNAEL
ncbi:GOLD domain-containing protein [Heracleum sosnowskyi]|uniref:GOLD domain-containing protein n=1 Tax=Heracleum sosnowskyi TaxID=360622 RepID=A0AAD8N190_9APIA|nr:GOLD domain-containing protein [Heracleum sosnowskyi]